MAANFYSKSTVVCVILVILLAVMVRDSNARPPWLTPGSGVFTQSAECHTDVFSYHVKLESYPALWKAYIEPWVQREEALQQDELLDLCQRCAKLTKSRLAYPACCSTDLQARKWCSDYVYFGRGQYDFY